MLRKAINKSIRFQFLKDISLILLVSTCVLSTALALNERDILKDSLTSKGVGYATNIAKRNENALMVSGAIELKHVLSELITDEDVVYTVIEDNNGKLLTSQFESINYKWSGLKEILARLPKSSELPEMIAACKKYASIKEVSVPITLGIDTLGKVTIGLSDTKIGKQIVRTVVFVCVLNLIVALLIGTVLFVASKKRILDPIIALGHAASLLAKGDLKSKVKIKATGEIQLLVDSFNQMAQDLEKTTVSKDYVDNIIKSMLDMMIVLGSDRTITRANTAVCNRLGYSEEELVGRHMDVVYCGDDLDKLFSQEAIANQEKIYRAADGNTMTVLLSGATLRDSEKNLQGWVFVAQDISERKIAEQALSDRTMELSRSNAELQQFANIASHDLQEPLRKVLAFGERLADKYGDRLDERGLDYLQRMQGASLRMRHFIEDLLSFSRVTTKAKPFKEVDLNLLLKEVLQNLEIRIEESGGRIEIGKLAMIEADGFQVQQLFQNLISNALKFAQNGVPPQVKVIGKLVEEAIGKEYSALAVTYYQITVEDNGIGFDEIYKEKIFGVFQRLHGKDEYEGTGIGLSVCQKIVERHKGTIRATGKPGKGAKFTVTLPVQQSLTSYPNHNNSTFRLF